MISSLWGQERWVMLIALHRLKQLGKQKLAKIWLQMSNQSETQTGRTPESWCRCFSVLTHFVMMNTSRDSSVMFCPCVLWSDLLWLLLLSLLVSFWLPAVNQILTNLKTTNYDSLVKNKRTDKSLYSPRTNNTPFSWL